MKAIATVAKIQKHHAFLALCFTFFLLTALYIYLLSASVIHVVINQEIEEKIHKTHSEIADLEAEYMEKQSDIASMVISDNGFVEAPKVFIAKNPASVVTKR